MRRVYVVPLALLLTGAAGYAVTETAIPDDATRWTGEEHVAADLAVHTALRCLDNPLQRLLIQKLYVRSLRVSDGTSTTSVPGEWANDSPPALSRPDLHVRGEEQYFIAEVIGYTLFALPVVSVETTGGRYWPGNCRVDGSLGSLVSDADP